jgi:hypothetical protein
MIDMEQPSAIFDQLNQSVESQFNANTIIYVKSLSDGVNGKRCSVCGASPMRRTQVVWAENTRQVGGRIVVQSNVGRRVAPPKRPAPPLRRSVGYFPRSVYPAAALALAAILALFLFLCCVTGAATMPGSRSSLLLDVPVAAIVGSALIVFLIVGINYVRRIHAADAVRQAAAENVAASEFAREMRRYEERCEHDRRLFEKWKRSWFCMSCAAVVVEQREAAGHNP